VLSGRIYAVDLRRAEALKFDWPAAQRTPFSGITTENVLIVMDMKKSVIDSVFKSYYVYSVYTWDAIHGTLKIYNL